MINGDLLRYNLENKKFVVFDFEGDLNLYFSTPFQLGFIVYHGNQIQKEYDFYIKWPNLYISDFVKQYAHYNPHRMEREGKDPKEVFEIFGQFLNNPEYNIVGANILSFDCNLAYNCFKRLGMKHNWDFLARCYDTNPLFKGYKLDVKPDNNNLLAYQYSMNSILRKGLKSNVGHVAKEFGIPFDEARMHDGIYDCDIIGKNFFELIKKIEIK